MTLNEAKNGFEEAMGGVNLDWWLATAERKAELIKILPSLWCRSGRWRSFFYEEGGGI